MTNKYGLKRHIPNPVAKEVRQECYFGCVICGTIPFTFEHFDPPFKDATEHNPKGIALLCNGHHFDKTKGILPTSKVAKARKKPFNKNKNPIWRTNFGSDELKLVVGSNSVKGSKVGFSINDHIILGIEAPNTKHEDWFITGSFCDYSGNETIKFNNNEIEIYSGSLDITFVGTYLRVFGRDNISVARVAFQLENNQIKVEELNMRLGNGHKLSISKDNFKIEGPEYNLQLQNYCSENFSGSMVQVGQQKSQNGFNTVDINVPVLGQWSDWVSKDK